MMLNTFSTFAEYGFIEGVRKFFPATSVRNKLIEQYQLRQLRKLVNYAYNKSSFYYELYSNYGIKEKDIPFIDFNDLPIITKKEITENKERVFTDLKLKYQTVYDCVCNTLKKSWQDQDDYTCLTTSGSSGKKMIVVYSREEWAKVVTKALLYASHPKSLPSQNIKLAGLTMTAGRSAGVLLCRDVPKEKYNLKEISILDPIEQIVKELNEFRPDYVFSYPGIFLSLMHYKKRGVLNIFPKVIALSGELLTTADQNEMADVFQAQVVNSYGASECLMIGSKSREANYFRMYPQCSKVEILNDKNEHVEPGESGQVVVTNFMNYTQPFIRYALGDSAIYAIDERGEPCIKEVIGRHHQPIVFETNSLR